jgi:hypothetical protein
MIERARPQTRRHRGSRRARRLLVAAGLLLVFAIGIAVGQALDDSPATGGTQTGVRTLRPLQLPPAARSTVTITVEKP